MSDVATNGAAASAAYAIRGRLLLGRDLVPGAVVVSDGRIVAVLREPRAGDLPARVIEAEIVAPGLIDLQVNGGFGVEIGTDPTAIAQVAAHLPRTGVTAFLPTVVSAPAADYPHVLAAFAAATSMAGARPLGLHIEGPFISPARHGAHRRAVIEAADQALFATLLAADAVRLMTLAPERAGGTARIRHLVERGIVASLGHTDATWEEFTAGVDAGATMATHLFNAMAPFHHRAPGAVGAALNDDRVTVGLVVDGVHSHPAAVRLALRVKGVERIALVTDMMAAAGMAPGTYALGGQEVIVDATSARLADGTLAGAILTLDQAVRNVVTWTDATAADALRMASEVPARLLGLPRAGRLTFGGDADLVLLDAALQVEATIIGGREVYRREGR